MNKNWLDFEYSNKQVSSHGGIAPVKRFLDKTNFDRFIDSQALPAPGSNAGYCPKQILISFMLSVWLGANRFSHTAMLRYDKVLQEIFGWKRSPSDNTYQRFFKKLGIGTSRSFYFQAFQWFFQELQLKYITLDVDSTVWTRYGEQEGASKGYNPKKRGRNSHHPIIAVISEVKMIANFWLRSGNVSSNNRMLDFLEETYGILSGKVVGLLRADSGFYSHEIMNWLENKGTDYLIAIKMYPFLKIQIKDHVKWKHLAKGIEIGEFEYQGYKWGKKRRIVVVRQNIQERPKAGGKTIFPDDEIYQNYRYSAFCTSLRYSAHDIWLLYRKRGDAENRIKELEYDFGADSFCMQSFEATESALRAVMLSYNFMALFRLAVLQTKQFQRLSTIRFNCFSIGSWVVQKGRKRILKMSVDMKKRQWMEGIFSNSSNFDWNKLKTY